MVGAGTLTLEIDGPATPASVWERVSEGRPDLLALQPRLRCAVDREYVAWDAQLRDGVEVAFIPPTAGG